MILYYKLSDVNITNIFKIIVSSKNSIVVSGISLNEEVYSYMYVRTLARSLRIKKYL